MEFVVFLGALALSAIVYCVVAYWPRRLPKDQTVEAIRQRIEDEESE
ncbi:hypothetical protein [Nocardia wallacei]|nr:hypothetical protein [Nocardia wallacei]